MIDLHAQTSCNALRKKSSGSSGGMASPIGRSLSSMPSLGTERDSSPTTRPGCAVVLERDYARPKSKCNVTLPTWQSCDVTRIAPNSIHLFVQCDLSHRAAYVRQISQSRRAREQSSLLLATPAAVFGWPSSSYSNDEVSR